MILSVSLMQCIFSISGFPYLLVSQGFIPAESSNRRRDAEWMQYAAAPVCWYYLSVIISFTPETWALKKKSTVHPREPPTIRFFALQSGLKVKRKLRF